WRFAGACGSRVRTARLERAAIPAGGEEQTRLPSRRGRVRRAGPAHRDRRRTIREDASPGGVVNLVANPMFKCLVSWSSGKDSAWLVHVLRQQRDVEIAALLTTINESVQRVAMHAVRVAVLQAQADALGLPLW